MSTPTHQDIADRMDALRDEENAARDAKLASIEKERQSLQELCGSRGHVYKRHPFLIGKARACVYCEKAEG